MDGMPIDEAIAEGAIANDVAPDAAIAEETVTNGVTTADAFFKGTITNNASSDGAKVEDAVTNDVATAGTKVKEALASDECESDAANTVASSSVAQPEGAERAAEEGNFNMGTFKLVCTSKDGKLCLFEDAQGHLTAVRAAKLA